MELEAPFNEQCCGRVNWQNGAGDHVVVPKLTRCFSCCSTRLKTFPPHLVNKKRRLFFMTFGRFTVVNTANN